MGDSSNQEPFSINIVNNNHLSGYNTSAKANGAKVLLSDSSKKSNYKNLIQNFKPNQYQPQIHPLSKIDEEKRNEIYCRILEQPDLKWVLREHQVNY